MNKSTETFIPRVCLLKFKKQFEHCQSRAINIFNYSEYHSCMSLIYQDYNKCVRINRKIYVEDKMHGERISDLFIYDSWTY